MYEYTPRANIPSLYLNIEGSVWASWAGEVDVLDVLVLDEDGRLVHEDEPSLQRVHEPRGSLTTIILGLFVKLRK